MKKITVIGIICIFIDQITKLVITHKIGLNTCEKVIHRFFSLCYVHNEGAAWSILTGSRLFLILLPFVVIPIVYYALIKGKRQTLLNQLSFGMLFGGTIGNLIDRIFHGYVIDFLSFNIFGYDFPIFNMADIFIVVSIGLLVFFLKDDKNEVQSSE